MSMNDVFQNNNHVINYLDYYLNLDNPEYAVLINGDWGIGKTFLIKEYVTRLSRKDISDDKKIKITCQKSWFRCKLSRRRVKFQNKEKPEKKIVHVSLNGLRSGAEINEAITEEVYPIWKNKWIKTISRVGSESIKIAAKTHMVDLDSLNVKKLFNLRRSSITYIFDDLERCSMPLEDILGYINTFVEYDHCNVLIIANEEEIRKKYLQANNESQTNDKCIYDRIKEKVIGKTLTLMPETERALDCFLKNLDESSQSLLKWESLIMDIYKVSEINNLRILKQSIHDFERVYNILAEKHKTHEDFMKDLIRLFFALSFEIKMGRFACKDIKYWKKKNIQEAVKLASYQKTNEDKEEDPLTKYGEIKSNAHYGTFFSVDLLYNIFEAGFIDKETIRREVDKLSYFNKDEAPSWKKLCSWRDSTYKEATKNLELFETDFQQRKFVDFGEILHAFGMRIYLSRGGVIKKSLKEIESECMVYVDDIVEQAATLHWHESFVQQGDAYGWAFPASDSGEWKRVKTYLNNKVKQASQEYFIKKIRKNILINYQTFEACIKETEDSEYRDIPISNYFNINGFCNFLLKGTPREGRELFYPLLRRYRGRPELLTQEKSIWNDLKIHLQKMLVSSPWQQLAISDYISLIDENFLGKEQNR